MTSETKNERPSRSGLFGGHGRTHPDVFFLFLIFFLFSAPSAKKKTNQNLLFFLLLLPHKRKHDRKETASMRFRAILESILLAKSKKNCFCFFSSRETHQNDPSGRFMGAFIYSPQRCCQHGSIPTTTFFFYLFLFLGFFVAVVARSFFVSFLQRAHKRKKEQENKTKTKAKAKKKKRQRPAANEPTATKWQ